MRRRASRREPLITPRAVALVALGFLLAGLAGGGAYFLPALAAAAQISDTGALNRGSSNPTPVATAGAPTAAPVATNLQPFTVLLLGSDDDQKFTGTPLTQSMILVRVDPGAKHVTMLSIPRDLWVPIANGGPARIDAAYSYGGARAAIATVENNFGIHVDDYVWIGLAGLIKVIDYVGGVDVVTSNPVLDDFYPADINTNDPYGYERVAILPGPQHLDGANALRYVRSRHGDLREDFGRSFRQQQVLLALRAKAKTLNPADIPDVATVFSGQLKTSLSLERVRQLLPIAGQIQTQDVKQIVLVGGYTTNATIDGQDVLIPEWGAILPLVHRYFE